MERLKKYLPFLMFSCRKTTELIDKKSVLPLAINEKIILFYHETICKTCHHYKNQSQLIDATFEKMYQEKNPSSKLSIEKKELIIEKMKELG
jgi:hypothetical protein